MNRKNRAERAQHASPLLIVILVIVLAACQGSSAPPTPTPLVIVRQLATLAPTKTLSPVQREATQQALAAVPTLAPPTIPPTITPYVGVFLGETQNVLNPPLQPSLPPLLLDPTQSAAETTRLICAFPPDEAFGTGWATEPRALNTLGCPIQERFGFSGTVQVFENGVMYANEDTGEVWAIAPGTLISAGNFWYTDEALPLSTVGIEAPAGLFVPEGLIGQAWLTVIEARQALGFATTQQQAIDVNIQRFEGGSLFLDATVGQVFALLVTGDAYGPFEP